MGGGKQRSGAGRGVSEGRREVEYIREVWGPG